MKLTKTQRETLAFLRSEVTYDGAVPGPDRVREYFRLASTGASACRLNALVKAGLVQHKPRGPWELTEAGWAYSVEAEPVDDTRRPWPFVRAKRPAFVMPGTYSGPSGLGGLIGRPGCSAPQQQKGWMGA